MPNNEEQQRKADETSEETLSFNDSCGIPAIGQVDAPGDFKKGILEIPDDERYVDEP